MRKILVYPLTVVFYLIFGLILLLFHPIQVICLNVFGYNAHRKSVVVMNFLIINCFHLLGAKISFRGFEKLPQGKPLIIIANHQSIWDIPPIVWGFRHHHPKFISKIELAKNIPSISYNLRHGGSVMIDRRSGAQSIRELIKLGQRIEANNWSVCIFPEGTRSYDGKIKKFQPGGVHALLKASPSALIVPFVIDGNYQLQSRNSRFMNIGTILKYTVLDTIEPAGLSVEALVEKTEQMIGTALGQ
jgi:1-acyl-sn-glycerol-3-phosphate acyltransferase